MTDAEDGIAEDGIGDGVGRTALMVAAARAIETHRTDTLVRDVHAEHFVRAARASADWPVRPEQVPDGDANPLWGRLGRYFGLRTRVFDDFALRSARSGARQIVLLGAGLDTRAFRLDWPPDRVVFELDSAGVLAFKRNVLAGRRAVPRAALVPIAVDLRTDWSGALTAAGFDPTLPTVWLAEGLLFYLPAAAERRLVDTIHRLSVPGSALAYEAKADATSLAAASDPIYAATLHQIGVNFLALFDGAPRPDSAADLRARGWSTSVRTPFDHAHLNPRALPAEPRDTLATNRWAFATLG
ncbi:SAM-dependent methyltransferase [Streptomyces sp. B6B3]